MNPTGLYVPDNFAHLSVDCQSSPVREPLLAPHPIAPEIPTGEESGVADFDLSIWHGLWAPKGTPKPIIARLNESIVEALAYPSVRKALGDAGQEIATREQQTPEGFRAFQIAEIKKWWPIIKAANIKGE